MNSWRKKTAVLALSVYAFSATFLYAAVEYASYISGLANRFQTKIIDQNTNYDQYSTTQKEFIYSEIKIFKSTANSLQETYTDTGKPQDKELFGLKVLDTYSSDVSKRVSSLSPETQVIAKDLIKNIGIYELGQELSAEAQGGSSNPNGSGDVIAGNAVKTASATTPNGRIDEAECSISIGTKFSLTACVDAFFGTLIKFTLVNLAIGVFYFAGTFLQAAIAFGIVSFKGIVGDISSTSSGVYTLWLLTRNLVWTGILFSFFYLALLQLFDRRHEFGRAVAMIVVFALFSSFSFRASLFLIDISNAVTVTIYKGVGGENPPSRWDDMLTSKPLIATKYIGLLGYQNFSDLAFGSAQKNSILDVSGGSGKTSINLIFAITMLFNAYVIFMMGILFAVRDVALFAGVILSPLLLVDKVIPILHGPAEKFRRLFFGQLLFAPIFMLAMYIGLKLSETLSNSLRISNTSGAFGLKIFNLIAISAIFYYTYNYCKKLSGDLGSAALGGFGSFAQRAMIATPLGLAGKATAALGQNTLGAAARRLSRDGGILDRNRNALYGLGDRAFNAARYAGNSATYDFNNSKIIANAGSALGKFVDNKNGFTANGSFIDKSNSFSDKEKALKEKISYINENYKDPKDRDIAMQRVLNSGTLTGGVNLLGDKILSKKVLDERTEKARKINDTMRNLESFTKEAKTNSKTRAIRDSFDSIDFEDGDLTKLSEELEKLRKKADQGGGEAKKIFDTMLKKKVSSFFTSKIQSGDILRKSDGSKLVPSESTIEDFTAAAMGYIKTNEQQIKNLFGEDQSLSKEENVERLETLSQAVESSMKKTVENIWITENERSNKIAKIKKEGLARLSNSGPLTFPELSEIPPNPTSPTPASKTPSNQSEITEVTELKAA